MDGDDVGLARNRFGVGVREGHAAPSGLGVFIGPVSQGVALGYHIVPLWGGKPVPPSGPKTGASLERKTSAPLGSKTGVSR